MMSNKNKMMPKKSVPLDYQLLELQKLLGLWPSCPDKVLQQFVQLQLGTTVTRVVIQQAKKQLGLLTPEHEEKTKRKKLYAEYFTLHIYQQEGLFTNREKTILSRVKAFMQSEFNETTNVTLLKLWVGDISCCVLSQGTPEKRGFFVTRRLGELKAMGVNASKEQHTLL